MSGVRAGPSRGVRVKQTQFVDSVMQMAPDERFRRVSEGRIRFRDVDVPGDGYKSLQATQCRVSGSKLTCFGSDNEFFGDHVVAFGDRNLFHGKHCKAFGEDCIGIDASNLFFTLDGERYNVPAPPEPVDERVEREIMPVVGVDARTNRWKASAHDVEGSSKPSPAPRLDCTVCQTNARDVIFEPCGHMACCRDCTRHMANTALAGKCPECRAPIKYYLAIYY